MAKKILKIAVDLTSLLAGGDNGGAKIFILELIEQLAAEHPTTHFLLLTNASAHNELAAMDAPNVSRLLVVNPATFLLRAWGRLRREGVRLLAYLPSRWQLLMGRVGSFLNVQLKKKSPNWLQNLGVDLLFCPFGEPKYGERDIPSVCIVHDLQFKTFPEFFSFEERVQRGYVLKKVAACATRIVAVSEYTHQTLTRCSDEVANKVSTIPWRISSPQRVADDEADKVLARLGLSKQQYLLYPANFWKHKNHEMLLTAFGLVCNNNQDSSIKLVCTGALKVRQEWLMRATERMGLASRVVFPGFLLNTELSVLMQEARGLVFPSLYEGFGRPVLEAMVVGVPVACSNVTSLPEVVGDAAISFNPMVPKEMAGAIETLIHDNLLREEKIKLGYARAALFRDEGRLASDYWVVFKQAVSEGCNSHG